MLQALPANMMLSSNFLSDDQLLKTHVRKISLFFPGKGQLGACKSSTRTVSLLGLVFHFSPSGEEIVSHGSSHLKRNNVDGQINKQPSRRP